MLWFLHVVPQSISSRENSVGRATDRDGPWRASLAARTASTRRSNVWKTFASAWCQTARNSVHIKSRRTSLCRECNWFFPTSPTKTSYLIYLVTRSLPLLQINPMSSLCRSYHSGRQWIRADIKIQSHEFSGFPSNHSNPTVLWHSLHLLDKTFMTIIN